MTSLRNWEICARPFPDGCVGGLPKFNWHALKAGEAYQPTERFYVFYSVCGQANWKGTNDIVSLRRLEDGLQVFLKDGGECFLAFNEEKH